MIDYYRDFFERHQWLENGLSWTVVRPLNEKITLDDLLRRLNGGPDPERRTMEYPREEAMDEDRPVLLVTGKEGAWGFLELAHGFGLSDRVLTELSEESHVWMVTWHFNGGYTILHAADGEIRAWMRDFLFTEHIVEQGDPSVLADFRTMLDGLGPEDYSGKRSAAFAFIEATTGMRLETGWPDVENTPVVILDNPDA
ncbi:hypothetical protein ACFQ08_26195 [Streptosporangium algeriense]|uniref:SUKH-4 immunity protein of toxin-antitoxin system n=1 Tax=Streptosporangium algeriense TaxID=1682748 RepID=A0ABW3DY22_9ACTN